MTDPQAKHPIDEFFRRSFENLPAQADPSGWDSPSDEVWLNIKKNLRPGKGLGLKAIGMVAVIAAATAIVAVWLYPAVQKQPVEPIQTEQNTPEESAPTTTGRPTDAAPTPSAMAPTDLSVNSPSYKKSKKDAQNKLFKSPKTIESAPAAQSSNGAQPLPGSKGTLPPNSLEEKRQKADNALQQKQGN